MLSNFSRSFVHSFPAGNPTLIFTGSTLNFPANYNFVNPNPGAAGIYTDASPPRFYLDKTRRNFRRITFSAPLLTTDTLFTITGMTITGIQTEVVTLLENLGATSAVSTNFYLYLTSMTASPNTVALETISIGMDIGYSNWIIHDGSPFNNFVSVTGTGTWSINGTLQKWTTSNSSVAGFPSAPVVYNPPVMAIQANLTSQATSTANPISVTPPYNALQFNVTTSPSASLYWYFASQNIL